MVHFVGITGERHEASIGFAISLLRLQMEFTKLQHHQLYVTFAADINQAVNGYVETKATGPMVCVDTRCGFSTDFVTAALDPDTPDFVVGVYPLPMIDWERVQTRLDSTESTEPVEFSGNVYNVDLDPSKGFHKKRYMRAKIKPVNGTLGVFRLTAKKVQDIIAKAEKSNKKAYVVFREGLDDQFKEWLTKENFFVKLADNEVYADLESNINNTGVCEFAGCVGQRTQLR